MVALIPQSMVTHDTPTGEKEGTMTATSTELIRPQEVADILLGGGNVEVLDEVDIEQDIIRRILTASSLDEAFASAETTKASELDGVLIEVHQVRWAKSGYEAGPAIYAILDVTRDKSREHEAVSMGGRSLMASFWWAEQNAEWPLKGTLRKRQSQTNPERKFWTFELA